MPESMTGPSAAGTGETVPIAGRGPSSGLRSGGLRVRPAGPDDVAAVAAVLADAVAWLGRRGSGLWQEGIEGAEVERHVAGGHVHLAHDSAGEVAGTLRLEWSDPSTWGPAGDDALAGYVHRLAIPRSHSGLGVGRQLLTWAAGATAGRGRPLLRLDCAADVPALRRYYQVAGFRCVGGALAGGRWPVHLLEREVSTGARATPD